VFVLSLVYHSVVTESPSLSKKKPIGGVSLFGGVDLFGGTSPGD